MSEQVLPPGSEMLGQGVKVLLANIQRNFWGNSDFVSGLKRSLIEVQLKTKALNPADVSFGQVFELNNQGSPIEQKTMQALWSQRITQMRTQMPVLLFDLHALSKQKGRPLKIEDIFAALISSLNITGDNSIRSISLKKNQGFYPIYVINKLGKRSDYTGSADVEKLMGEISVANKQKNLDTGVAVVYPEHQNSDVDMFIYMFAEPQLSQLRDARRNLAIFITRSALDESQKQYASPWFSKVNYTQVKALNPLKIIDLSKQFYDALDPNNPYLIRFLVAEYGSGKSFTIIKLLEQRIPGVTYIDGIRRFADQKKALNGQLIFVDEPVNFNATDLKEIMIAIKQAQGNKVAIFLVPNIEVRKKIVEQLHRL